MRGYRGPGSRGYMGGKGGGGVRRPWKTWLGEVSEGGRERGYRGPGRRG